MPWLEPLPDEIPPELRRLGWVLWRAEYRGGPKATKVPYQIAYPSRKASSTDPSTWGTFEDACEAFACPELAMQGLGCVLTQAARITCIDLDGALRGPLIADRLVQMLLARVPSWTEISPSGTGLHIFVRASLPEALKGDRFEAYSDTRYIAMTGHRWPGTPASLTTQQRYLDAVVAYLRQDLPARPAYQGPVTAPPDDLAGALRAKLEGWGIHAPIQPWADGYLAELRCPWSAEHTTGLEGARVMIRASGAFDFSCPHQHCEGRRWQAFKEAQP